MAVNKPPTKPRVLFINNVPFSDSGSNGKVFLSFFIDFEEASVAQLYFNDLPPYSKKFHTVFRVTDKDVIKHFLTLGRYVITGKIPPTHKIFHDTTLYLPTNAPKISKIVQDSEFIKYRIRNFLLSSIQIHKQKQFHEWIEQFDPTVILLAGAGYSYSYKILDNIARKYNLPYFVYFGDDYFIYNKGKSLFSKIFHPLFVWRYKPIVQNAQELFVISEKMKKEYEVFFKKKATILINAVKIDAFPS